MADGEKRTTWGPPGGTAGTCMTCGKEARSPKAFYCEDHRVDKHGRPVVPRETSPSPVESADNGSAGEAYAERTPVDPKAEKKERSGSLLGKLWGKNDDTPPKPVGERLGLPKSPERKPAAPKRRASTQAVADFWGDLVSPASALAARAGYVPMARAMDWSSPVVGEIIEEATRGTPVDRAIQPFVRNAEKWQDLYDMIGFWGAIGMAQRNPAQAEGALAFARKRFVNLLPRIAANIKKERAKEKAAADALIELMPDIRELFPDMADTDDPVGLLISSLFAPPEGYEAEPSSNGRHAAAV